MDSQAKVYLKKQMVLSFCMEMMKEDEMKAHDEGDTALTSRSCCNGDACCCRMGAEGDPNHDAVVARPGYSTMTSTGMHLTLMKKMDSVAILNLKDDKYIKHSGNVAFMCPHSVLKSARITVHYYKMTNTDEPFRGMPVVLNFTDTDLFLRCQGSSDNVSLTVESYEKQKLECFSSRDREVFSFVFYMGAAQEATRHFESAVYTGWFMKAINETVAMGHLSPESESSYFVLS